MSLTLTGAPTNPSLRRVFDERQDQIKSGFYCGDELNSVLDNTVWRRIGRGNQLVTKSSADAVDEAANRPTSKSLDDEEDTGSSVQGALAPELEPAVLSVIVFIDRENAWLRPCGGWKGPTQVTAKFEDLQMSLQGTLPPSGNPASATVLEDFPRSLATVQSLLDAVAAQSGSLTTPKTGVIVNNKVGGKNLKFRHVVFEKLDAGSTVSDEDTDAEWTMANWPVVYAEGATERDRISSTHQPVPLPAYGVDGDLIAPAQCNAMLAGSISRITFTLKHWFIENKKTNQNAQNTYVADIHSIRVLVPPVVQSISPTKRKTAAQDPGSRSPTKHIRSIR